MASRARIVCFGDSITQQGAREGGWVNLLAASYEARADVVNRGMSGYNTELASRADVLHTAFSARDEPPACVVLWFGANDCCTDWVQHVEVGRFEQNVRGLVSHVRALYEERELPFVVLTPPPVDEALRRTVVMENYGPQVRPSRDNSTIRVYCEAIKRVASDTPAVALVDAFYHMFEGREGLTCDGLHLNAEGNRVVHSLVFAALVERFPELHPKRMAAPFPPWRSFFAQEELARRTGHREVPPLRVLPKAVSVHSVEGVSSAFLALMGKSEFFSLSLDLKGHASLMLDSEFDAQVGDTLASEQGWRAVCFAKPMPFDLVGVLAGFTRVLADHSISVLAVATHHTDYVLIKEEHLHRAIRETSARGWRWAE